MKHLQPFLYFIKRKFDALSYRGKLMLSFVAVIIIPVIAISFITYFISTSLMEQQMEYSFSQTLQQVEINLDKRMKQVKEVAELINQDFNLRKILTSKEKKELYDELQDFKYINRYFKSLEDNFHIYKIRLFIPNKTMYVNEGYSFFDIDELKKVSGMDASILNYKNTAFWKATYYQYFKYSNSKYVLSAVSIMNDYLTMKNIGVCFVDIQEDELYKSIEDITGKDGTITSIIDNMGIVVSSKDKSTLGKTYISSYLKKILETKESGFKIDNHLIIIKRIATSEMILVSDIPLDIISNKTFIITKITFFIALAALICSVLLSKFFSNSLSRKLSYLLVAMKKNKSLEQEEFLQEVKIPLKLSDTDEIGQLITNYNQMVIHIKRLIDEMYHVKLQESEAKFKVLQAQINPHFLYNILETIKSFIHGNKQEQAIELIIVLGRFYRIALSKGKNKISIREELEMTQLYLNMQKIYYGNELELDIQLDDDILPFSIVKFTLQPLVENAIHHGFQHRGGKGHITIKGNFQGDDIVIQVIDNGMGIDEDNLVRLQSELENGTPSEVNGYGLYNVNARLHINKENNYGVKIISKSGEGTNVKIVIPQEV